jgi:hypothetical protein
MHEPRSAGRLRTPARLLLISTTLLLVAACSTPAAGTPIPTDEPTASPTVAATPEVTPTEAPTPTPEPGIGTKITVGDEQYVTVTAVDPWEGTDTQQPAAGNVFVAVKIRIDGITTTSFTSADFAVQDVTGEGHSEAAPGAAPHLSFQDGLEPDHYYEGYVTFEVPEAAAISLTLVYTPNFLDTTYEIQLF